MPKSVIFLTRCYLYAILGALTMQKKREEKKVEEVNSNLLTKELGKQSQIFEESQGELPLFTKKMMDEVLSMSDVVIKLDEELKIRRDSTRRTKLLKSQLRELAKETQKYKKKEEGLKLDS